MNTLRVLIVRSAWFLLYGLSGLFLFPLNLSLYGQQPGEKFLPDNLLNSQEEEVRLKNELRREGLTDAVIEKLWADREALIQSNRTVKWTHFKKKDKDPVPFAACSGMGAESGWGAWQGATGRYIWNGGSLPSPLTFNAPAAPVAPRFNITSGAGIDPCTPGGGGPALPVVAPNFGNASIQLGQPMINGASGGCSTPTTAGCAEQLIYPFTVSSSDTNFIYSYALVMENPGHSSYDQPFVRIGIYDSNGDSIPCGYFNYVAQTGLPGFYNSSCAGALYKPWTIVGINLSNYIGQVLTIVITNADCSQGGHYAHSYWDFSCQVFKPSPGAVCKGSQVTINAPTDPQIAYGYSWMLNHQPYAGPGSTTSTITPYPNPGDTFVVTVTQPSGCDFTLMYVPDVYEVNADFGYQNNCGTVAFTDSSVSLTAGTITNWNWSFPGGAPATSTGQNPSVTFPAGTYTATLIVTTQLGCKDTMKKSFTIAYPAANFNTAPVCVNTNMNFSDLSTGAGADPIATWGWNFGDGGTSSQQNPGHTYSVAGTYSVILTVTTQAGCIAQNTQSVTVYPAPIAGFTSSTVCFNNSTSFTDLSSGSPNQWSWNFGDGSTSTSASPSHTYSAAGTYTVSQLVTNLNGCKDSIALPVLVYAQPIASFVAPNVCLGLATQFVDSSSASSGSVNSWNWSFGDGNISNQQNPSHTYSAPGTYSVTLTVTAPGGCIDSITQTVTVNPLPQAAFIPNTVCFNNPTSFSDLSTGNPTIWYWDFGDGNSSPVQNPTHIYSAPGTYTATLIVTNAQGCKDTLPKVVIINPLPISQFTATPVCLGDTVYFTDQSSIQGGTIVSWGWNFADPASGQANTSSLQNPSHLFSGSGTFNVLLTVTSDSGCQSITVKPIQVYPLPQADFNPTSVCLNSPTSFTDLSGFTPPDSVAAWSWNFGDGTTSSLQNPLHTYTSAGTYSVSLLIATKNGCVDSADKLIVVYYPPVAAFSDSASGCAPLCTSFADLSSTLNGSISAWSWSFPGGTPDTSSQQNPSVCWNQPGVYDVQLAVSNSYGCVDSLLISQYITVFPWPTAEFCVAPLSASYMDPVFNFCDQWSSDVVVWNWNFGDSTSLDSINTDPAHSYSSMVTNNTYYSFIVTLAVQNQFGCWDTIKHSVEIVPEFVFYVPNAFTPNEDGKNDWFFGKGRGIKEFEIMIFDRWGNLIWDCEYQGKNTDWDAIGQDGLSSACQWDGKVERGSSDKFVQEDVYVWKIRLTDIFDKKHNYIGKVTAVR